MPSAIRPNETELGYRRRLADTHAADNTAPANMRPSIKCRSLKMNVAAIKYADEMEAYADGLETRVASAIAALKEVDGLSRQATPMMNTIQHVVCDALNTLRQEKLNAAKQTQSAE